MSEELQAKIKSFGALGYDIDRICMLLCDTEAEESALRKQWEDDNSDVRKLYRKGEAEAEYSIDVMLFESASSGDIRSLSELEKRKSARDREYKRKNKRNGTT